MENGKLSVPDHPIIPFIEGDGIGPDIWRASVNVFDSAVESAYNGGRKIDWLEILAGEKAHQHTGEWLPQKTLDLVTEHRVAIKGPLTTPVGGSWPGEAKKEKTSEMLSVQALDHSCSSNVLMTVPVHVQSHCSLSN